MVDTIATDLVSTAKRLTTMRQLAHKVAPAARRRHTPGSARRAALAEHLDHLLHAFTVAEHPLPGLHHSGEPLIDLDGLTVGAGWTAPT